MQAEDDRGYDGWDLDGEGEDAEALDLRGGGQGIQVHVRFKLLPLLAVVVEVLDDQGVLDLTGQGHLYRV